MTRLLAATALALAALTAGTIAPASAAPGGPCEGPVDVHCKLPCAPDELDCGMKPLCLVWLGNACLILES
jgi:hypothetical protein